MNRICNKCFKELPIEKFRSGKNGKWHRRQCKYCEDKDERQKRNAKIAIDPEYAARREEIAKTSRGRLSADRASGNRTEHWIYLDSRSSDSKYKRENDLDKEFIKKEIEKGCCYCNSHDGRMTLDRIDNSIGHIKTNVVPCCLRCNYIRRDMPHEAWMCLVPVIKKIVEDGMFDGWETQPWSTEKRQKKKDEV